MMMLSILQCVPVSLAVKHPSPQHNDAVIPVLHIWDGVVKVIMVKHLSLNFIRPKDDISKLICKL